MKEAFGGATVAEIAKKVGENYHTLRNYLKLKRDAPPRLWIAIAELTNYSPLWLLAGKGPKLIESDYAGPLFALEDENVGLSAEERALIRAEVLSVLGELLLPLESDRAQMNALLLPLIARLKQVKGMQ